MVSNHVPRSIEDLRLRAKEAEGTLKEQKRIWKTTNEDILIKVEKLSKEKEEKEGGHAQETEDMISELKSSIAEAVWEAKIKMVEDMEKGDVGSWNVAGWCDALTKLTGKQLNASKDLAGQVDKKKGGEKKKEEAKATPMGGDQTLDSI